MTRAVSDDLVRASADARNRVDNLSYVIACLVEAGATVSEERIAEWREARDAMVKASNDLFAAMKEPA
jgi:hypothetical protein